MKKPRLSTVPARTDLTDREFCKIIGGLIGAMVQMGDRDDVRNAVRWWAETDEAWKLFDVLPLVVDSTLDSLKGR